jgi:hypothetical protein
MYCFNSFGGEALMMTPSAKSNKSFAFGNETGSYPFSNSSRCPTKQSFCCGDLSIPFDGGDFDGDDELDVFEDVDDGDDDIDDDDDDDDNQISHRDLIVNSLGNVSFKYSRIFF